MTSRILVYNNSTLHDIDISTALSVDQNNQLTFDNKYFSVTAELCFEKHVPVEEIAETVEAFVFVVEEPPMDSNISSVIKDIDIFENFLSEVDPEIKLLLINTKDTLYETEFLEWCVDHGFEFIKYISSDESDNEGLMGQSEGMGRVKAALECHMWPYRTMKHEMQESKEEFGDYASSNTALTDFQSLMEGDGLDGDFESMFANMVRIKEVAGQLPDEERKRFAEKVAMSFWKAMGGSDDEVDNL